MSKPPFRLCSHIEKGEYFSSRMEHNRKHQPCFEKGGNQPMNEATDIDYWFLRDNGLNAKITLRILAIAYKEKGRLEKVQMG